MKSRPRLIPFVSAACMLACLALSGCGNLNVPLAESYPASSQHKARAVHHWDVLADDVANRIVTKLGAQGAERPPYVLNATPDSAFQQAFGDLLLTRLLERGVVLATDVAEVKDSGAQIRFTVQVVKHTQSVPNFTPLPLTTLAIGLAVARDFMNHVSTEASGMASGLALGLTLDNATAQLSGSALGGPTRTEVLVTTSVEREKRFVARTSDIYYIDNDDAALYLPKPAPPPLPPPAPVKNWKVIGS
jgi:hypothetical protein